MRISTAITTLCLVLFATAFAGGKPPVEVPAGADSLRSVYLYTEGIKQRAIAGDTLRAMELFGQAVRADSLFAPAYYELAAGNLDTDPETAMQQAQRAWQLDTANKWYLRLYGHSLLFNDRYAEALPVFLDLRRKAPQDYDSYRILAALYEQVQQPFSAIAVLDSAEVRFGRIPQLSALKQQLLVSTRQFDKAIDEARAACDEVPYDARNHAVLADLYGAAGQDSLALAEYAEALRIDSTDVRTLISLGDFYNNRHNYAALLDVTQRLFESDDLPLDLKIRRFEVFTSDTRFYREFYSRINTLASTLAIRYPRDKRVVELYARHQIASGELEYALALYKLHLSDTPPEKEYYHSVIDIESYLKRPDSVDLYVTRALELFPEETGFHLAKGNVLAYSNRYDSAIGVYKQALRRAATDSLRGVIWGLVGDTWHQKSEAADADKTARRKAMAECYKAYERSLGYRADNALVLNNYAYFLAVEGRDLEKALTMSSRALELTDNNPTYLDTHAWVLFRLGRTAQARKVMQQAIALDSQKSPELLVHYGDILHALGEQFLAETYWRKALELGYDQDEITRRFEQEAAPKKEESR